MKTPRAGDVSAQAARSPLHAPGDIFAHLNCRRASFGWLRFSDGEYAWAHPHNGRARGRRAVPQLPIAMRRLGAAGWGGGWMQGHLRHWDGMSRTPRPLTGVLQNSQPLLCKGEPHPLAAAAVRSNRN